MIDYVLTYLYTTLDEQLTIFYIWDIAFLCNSNGFVCQSDTFRFFFYTSFFLWFSYFYIIAFRFYRLSFFDGLCRCYCGTFYIRSYDAKY